MEMVEALEIYLRREGAFKLFSRPFWANLETKTSKFSCNDNHGGAFPSK